MLLAFLLHSSTAFTLARAPVLNGHPLAPATRARHHAVVAREIAFVAQSEARCEPFAATRARPLGDWFAQEDALRILMSQAESCRRLDEDAPPGSETQRWEVITPIEFPGMVARSVTPMDIRVDAAADRPTLSISSGASETQCSGGPGWAQALLSRIGEIATTVSSNTVDVQEDEGGGLTVVSRVKLTVKLSIPTLLLPPFVPAGPFERSGSESLQKLLDRDMGTVLGRFREGYLTWATGD